MAVHGIQKIYAARNVGSVEGAGFTDGFGDKGFPGEMHNGVDFVILENLFELRAIGQIDLQKSGGGRNGSAVAFLKIIEREYLMSTREQNFRADAADIPGGTGDQDIQRMAFRLRKWAR